MGIDRRHISKTKRAPPPTAQTGSFKANCYKNKKIIQALKITSFKRESMFELHKCKVFEESASQAFFLFQGHALKYLAIQCSILLHSHKLGHNLIVSSTQPVRRIYVSVLYPLRQKNFCVLFISRWIFSQPICFMVDLVHTSL